MLYPIIETYAFYLKAEREVKDTTVDRYGRVLRKLRDFLEKDLLQITKDDIRRYMSTLSNNKPSYRLFQLKTIRIFYKWLLEEGKIQQNPAANMKLPRQPKLLPKALSKSELEKLLGVIDTKTPSGKRNKLLFTTMYYTGARISETVNIRVQDINFTDGSLLIYGKGDKERVVYLEKVLLSALGIYIHENRLTDYIFLSKYGKRLCVRQAQLDIKKYADLAGIPLDKVTPHKIRHSTATHLVQNGYPLTGIGNLLGHSSIATTAIYTQIANNDLKEMQKSLHIPL